MYRHLFASIGLVYGIGDGTTTFNVPDLRGEFIRGADLGRGVDPSRVIGSSQSDSLKAHAHNFQFSLLGTVAGTELNIPNTGGTDGPFTTSSVGGSETRPRNIAMNYIIFTGEMGNY